MSVRLRYRHKKYNADTQDQLCTASGSNNQTVADDDEPPSQKHQRLDCTDLLSILFGDKVFDENPYPQNTSKNSRVQIEMDSYQMDPLASVTSNRLNWWKANQDGLPILANLAKRFLGVFASSVPCERLFSSARNIITETRSRLSPTNAEMLTYLHDNME